MHELSIALSIVEMVVEEAERLGVTRVDAVHVKVGPLSGVVPSALLASYELACETTPLEGSRLLIEEVPIVVHCPSCRAERPMSSMQAFCCQVCGTPTGEVLQGRELQVVALEIPR